MDWDEIYRTTPLAELHWYPGEPDDILKRAVDEGWLAGTTVVDIGAGQGTDAVYLAGCGYTVTAVDISREACRLAAEAAERRGVELRTVTADALDLPFAADAFDIVVERGCFHHLYHQDADTFAEEVARVLRPDGVYFYRNFTAAAQTNLPAAERLTDDVVEATFAPHFHSERSGEYQARGRGGREAAPMRWSLLRPT